MVDKLKSLPYSKIVTYSVLVAVFAALLDIALNFSGLSLFWVAAYTFVLSLVVQLVTAAARNYYYSKKVKATVVF